MSFSTDYRDKQLDEAVKTGVCEICKEKAVLECDKLCSELAAKEKEHYQDCILYGRLDLAKEVHRLNAKLETEKLENEALKLNLRAAVADECSRLAPLVDSLRSEIEELKEKLRLYTDPPYIPHREEGP